MKPATLIASALAAVVVVPSGALAQGASSGIQPPSAGKEAGEKAGSPGASGPARSGGSEATFKSLDKNGDGSISREEAKGSPYEKDFARLDKNSDGKLSREEHAAAETGGSSSSGSSGAGGVSEKAMKTY